MSKAKYVLALIALFSFCSQAEDFGRGWWHGRFVTYKIRNGLAIFQGDIVLGPVESLPQDQPVESALKPGEARDAAFLTGVNNAYLWPNAIVPYVLDSSLTPAMITAVNTAIATFQSNTPIKWVLRTSEANYVKFSAAPAGQASCGQSDSIGVLGGAQNIQVLKDSNCGAGTFIHEMGHAIGLEHEQTRSDRDYYVKVNFQNIDKNEISQYQPDPAQVDVLLYEQGSIMHYGVNDFQRTNFSGNAMDTIPLGIPIEHRARLSPGDIEAIRTIYGSPSTSTVVYTNPSGLQVIVDGTTVTTPQTYNWAPGTNHTLDVPAGAQPSSVAGTRLVFARWGNDGTKLQTIVAGPATRTIAANFAMQYLVKTSVGRGNGTVTVDPPSADGFYTFGTPVKITATPAVGYTFLGWGNSLGIDVSHGISSSPASFSVNYPGYIYSANFTNTPVTAITTNVPATNVTVDGNTVALPANFNWTAGSSHALAVPTPNQDNGSLGSPYRYTFRNWSVGTAPSINVTAAPNGGTIASTWTRKFLVSTYTSDAFDYYTSANGKLIVSPVSSDCNNPTATDCYYDAGTQLTFSASGVGPYIFTGWSGVPYSPVPGDLSGTAPTGSITLSDQVYLTADFAQPGRLTRSAVVSAANYNNLGVSPGEILAIFGLELGPPAQLQSAQVANGFFPTTVAQTRVLFDGVPAPVIYVSSGQISVVVPYAVAGKTTTRIQIEYAGKLGNAVNLPVVTSRPALITADSSGSGIVAAFNQDSSLHSAQNPAARGSVIVLYGTGEGATTPASVDGKLAVAPFTKPNTPVKVTIAGRDAQVLYFGAAPGLVAGVFQANVMIPNDCPRGLVPIYVTAGNYPSPATARIAVQ